MWDGKYAFEKSKIIQGDSLDKMKYIPNGSIDLIVTDPPYKIGAGVNAAIRVCTISISSLVGI
jgi:DNA modification methylase